MSFSLGLHKVSAAKMGLRGVIAATEKAPAKAMSGIAQNSLKAMPKRPNIMDIKDLPAAAPKKKGFLGGMFGF